MGEEMGNEEKGQELKKEEVEEQKKTENEEEEIVLKVDMHCQACARKIARALKGFQGVEEVRVDSKTSKVVVKGKTADPMKVLERIQRKSGRKVELISPLPKLPEPSTNKEPHEEEPIKAEKKEEQQPPPIVTAVLKIRMHCEACAQALQKRIRKIQGVELVQTDLANHRVTVKGVIDPEKLVDHVYKRTGKQAALVKDQEEKKGEEKAEKKEQENKEGKEEDKVEESPPTEVKRSEYWPPKYTTEYAYTPEIFSDENPNACSVM